MTQSSRKWEESAEKLRHLSPVSERSQSGAEDSQDAEAKFDAVKELDVEDGLSAETVDAQEVDEVGGREVEVDVLEHQEGGEDEATEEEGGFLACED